MEEEWKYIKGFECYQVSNLGNVRHVINGTLKFHIVNGYLKVGLYNSMTKQKKYFRVHRLVAEAFIPNPNNYPEVNHIDENKHNNCVINLEWCTREQNIEHSINTGTFKVRKVCQCDMKGNLINIFDSASEAERATGISRTHVCKVALERPGHKSAGGYLWVEYNKWLTLNSKS